MAKQDTCPICEHTYSKHPTARDVADMFNISYAKMLTLIRGGVIQAAKIKGKWRICKTEIVRAKRQNNTAIKKLKNHYVDLYHQGLDPEVIQKHVSEDFSKDNIIADSRGFAEKAIYESLPKRGDT